jgi:hypothetical protein
MNNITFKPPLMLTIQKTAELYGLPVNLVRSHVKSGLAVSVRCGKSRFLVNADKYGEFLNSNRETPPEVANSRAINLRT